MSTFFFRLCGPMKSWGTQSRFLVRDTGPEPSKSGVVGLICAAMGKPRDDREAIAKIAGLRMAVRADRPGTMLMDYHTAEDVIRADESGAGTVVSRRYYLADAQFLVALEGERAVLEEIAQALSAPRWQVFLGRKSFVPSAPLILPPGSALGPRMERGRTGAKCVIVSLARSSRRNPWPPAGGIARCDR